MTFFIQTLSPLIKSPLSLLIDWHKNDPFQAEIRKKKSRFFGEFGNAWMRFKKYLFHSHALWSENDLIDIDCSVAILLMLSMLLLDKWCFNASLPFSVSNSTKRIKWTQQNDKKNSFYTSNAMQYWVRDGSSFAISIFIFDSLVAFAFLVHLYVVY